MAGLRKNPKAPASKLHPRNLHHGRYDLPLLSQHHPSLKLFTTEKNNGELTINFGDPKAVMALNQALLCCYYNVNLWQIPPGYLCPPIPGRADYIHYLADLLARSNGGNIPKGKNVRVLDVGCGANCIYPIIGSQSYGWKFVGSDIDEVSVKSAQNIAQSNACLKKNLKFVYQSNKKSIFKGIIEPDDVYELTMCNPPFYGSLEEAEESNFRKQKNLHKHRTKKGLVSDNKGERNFGGQKAELWCPGGEIKFLKSMADESVMFAEQVTWFSSLVSKGENVAVFKKRLLKLGARQVEVINMSQGNKVSRFVAWSFLPV